MKLITDISEQTKGITEARENGEKVYFLEGVFMQAEKRNRNGRIYEKAVLKDAVDRYIDEQVKTNRAVGELNHPCFKRDTEVLVAGEGWKSVADVKKGEQVYTFNKETQQIEIQPVLAEIKNYYGNNKMYRFVGRGIDTTVTPDHKFIVLKRGDRAGKVKRVVTLTAKEIFEGWKDRSLSHDYIPRTTLEWDINYDETKEIIIESTDDTNKCEYKGYTSDLKIPETIFAQFMGLYMAEGCTVLEQQGHYSINIYQRKEKNIDIIRSIISAMPIHFNERKAESGTYTWSSHDRRLGKYLHKFGICYDKHLDDKVKNLSPKACLEFIKYFNLGDGRTRRSGKMKDIFSTSERLIDDMSELLVRCGLAFNKKSEICLEDYTFAGRTIKAESKSELFFLEILSTKGVYIDNRFLDIQETTNGTEDEYVYCIHTANETFMARENGQNFWTGNCSPTINYKEVSHKIESLDWDGNDVVGKAKILNTPNGIIAKSLIDGGVQLGVSSRGMGSISKRESIDYVNKDFVLNTVDIVQDPSAPHAYVNPMFEGAYWKDGIMEGIEWEMKNGELIPRNIKDINKIEQEFKENMSVNESAKYFALRRYLQTLAK